MLDSKIVKVFNQYAIRAPATMISGEATFNGSNGFKSECRD